MHVVVAGLYAFVIWVALVAYSLIVGVPTSTLIVLAPVLFSAALVGIWAVEAAIGALAWFVRLRLRPGKN